MCFLFWTRYNLVLHSHYPIETAFVNVANELHVVIHHGCFSAHILSALCAAFDTWITHFFWQDFLYTGYQSMSWFFFNLMAYSFLTFQLIFLILAAVKVIVFLGYVLKQLLCLYWLLWGSYIIFSIYKMNWQHLYTVNFKNFVSNLNLSLNSRLKYSATSLTSKCE